MEALPPAMQLASDKLEEWMKLRETIGSCYAARQLGLREEYLYKLAKQRGITIPRLTAKVANKAAGRGLTETEKARRVGIVQEFKARRAQNIPTTKACEGLGVDLGKLCNWTRYLPIKINS